MRRPIPAPRSSIAAAIAAIALLAGLVLPVGAGQASSGDRGTGGTAPGSDAGAPRSGPTGRAPARAWLGRAIEVRHGPVSVTLADPASDGHRLGDVRIVSVPTTDARGAQIGRLDATLTTTAVDVPAPGDEIRISTLVFSFGDHGIDQVVVGGSAVYPAQGATLAVGSVTTRPIQGGSGRFTAATGSAVSEHLADGSWRHTLHLVAGRVALDRALVPMRPPAHVRPFDRPAAQRSSDAGPLHWRALIRALWARLADGDDGPPGLRRRSRDAHAAPGRGRRHAFGPVGDRPMGRGFGRGHERWPAGVPVGPADAAGGTETTGLAIVRDDLGRALPASAVGQELGLWHYTIPAGARLEPHTHAGWQIARVIAGRLTYTVIAGDGILITADGASRPIGPGTYMLRPGDSVVEDPDLEHHGANPGPRDVELVAATLYPEGAPLSVPLASPTPPVSPTPPATTPAPAPSQAP